MTKKSAHVIRPSSDKLVSWSEAEEEAMRQAMRDSIKYFKQNTTTTTPTGISPY